MYQWSIEEKQLDLRFTWTISRGASDKKRLFFIRVADKNHSALGEVAGITRNGEPANDIITAFNKASLSEINSIADSLKLPLHPHLRFGLSSALTHFLAAKSQVPLHEYLGCPAPMPIKTSFSLPILPEKETEDFFNEYKLKRFASLKIKIGKDQDTSPVRTLASLYDGPIRVDANEAFQSAQQVMEFMTSLGEANIEFLEQPLPAHLEQEYRKLKPLAPCPVIADESLQDQDIPESWSELFHGINVKLMKAGSYQQAIKQLQQARQLGLKTMLGCMVETSLGIAGALSIGADVDYFDLDGFMYFKNPPHQFVSESNGQLQILANFQEMGR